MNLLRYSYICYICHKLPALIGIPYTQESPVSIDDDLEDVRACATRGRRPKRMHFPFSITGSIKGSVELKVPWLVNLLIAPGPFQSGDMLGSAGDLP